MELNISAKQFFFDTAKVIAAVDEERRKVISQQLAYVRRTAQKSVLRRRKRVSRPGSPPSVRAKVGLKKILFAYDPRSGGGVVGPLLFNGRGAVPAPGLLEHGGRVRVTKTQYLKRKRRKKNESKYVTLKKGKSLRYRPRPFMSVALDREIKAGTIPQAWEGVVKG